MKNRAIASSLSWSFAWLFSATPLAQDSPLTGSERTSHFEIRFVPGSRAEVSVDRVAALVEDDLTRILEALGVEAFPHTIRLFLYDDVPTLQKITGVPSAGYSVPLESHVPHDNDQTRVHELVHVVAEKFAERGPEERNLFFAEGLANAVLRFVSGVSVDAVAAFHRRRGDLPTMAEMHAVQDFYGWLREHPAVNSYDVAGSWMRYLLDTYGAGKVRQYYKGVSVQDAFGAGLEEIEAGWHARLAKVSLRPGVLSLLQQRHGRTAAERNPSDAALDAAVMGPATEWRSLGKEDLVAGEPGLWQRRGDSDVFLLSGKKNVGDWCIARLGKDLVGDAMVRGTLQAGEGCFGVQIQLGQHCQAMILRGQGTFLYSEAGGVGHDGKVQLGDKPVTIVLRRQGGKASVWIDGRLICEAPIEGETTAVAVGCVGGAATCSKVAVRRL